MTSKPMPIETSNKPKECAAHIQDSAAHMERSTVRVEDSADRRTELAADRTVFAAERTYAAWVRTGSPHRSLAALACNDKRSAFVLFSVFCFAAGVWRHLYPGPPPPMPDAARIHPVILVLVNVILGMVSIAALIGIWLDPS